MKQWYISNFLYYCVHRARVEFGQKRNVVSFTLNLSLLIASSFSSSVFFCLAVPEVLKARQNSDANRKLQTATGGEERKTRRKKMRWDFPYLPLAVGTAEHML